MRVVVTGGAGFIGSHVAEAFVGRGHDVVALDDLSTGYTENVPEGAELVVGDVADEEVTRAAVLGADLVFHLAASRAVLRSVLDPVATDRANTHGCVILLKAAVDAGVRRFVYASSSSVYGGTNVMPTPESVPTVPRSPYAVTKVAGEHYCRVFSELFGLETVCLRYFNVYGPRQRPDSAYAAVIPLFINALLTGEAPVIHGDGRQFRSFTYVDDVVAANLAVADAPASVCQGQAYNVAHGGTADLLTLLATLGRIIGVQPDPVFTEPRPGDIRHSHADVSAAARTFGFTPRFGLDEGLARTVQWVAARV